VPDQQEMVARALGVAAAGYLQRAVREGDVIGISWGHALNAMVSAVQSQPTRGTHVVQLIGGLGPPEAEVHATSLSRKLAQQLGSKLTLIAAPGIVDSRKVKRAILSDSHVRTAMELFSKMRMAFVGIGAPTPDSLVVRDGTIMSESRLEDLRRKGAVGDIALRYFDVQGAPIHSDLDERVIGITLEQLRRTPLVVGVAGGPLKDEAVRGALSGKLVDVLITDHALAQRLLEAGRGTPGR
jgi:DNA-binding transcriptional regulator LsrR (DeoR family)